MLILLEAGYNGLIWVIAFVFLIIGIIAFLVSLFGVYLYSLISKKSYTRKEFITRAFVATFMLLLISGIVCGTIM